ncbi:MAG TPA: glycoside hydrolase family 30 beta sandwich domain-containing protein [Chryseolinea sp.]|nr:glycoside hydrolase family 30 beta sandwich domain-containing protein [Chryseolinea sp.]
MKINSTHSATVIYLFAIALIPACSPSDKQNAQVDNAIEVTITSGDKKFLLSKTEPLLFKPDSANGVVIQVDTSQRFQSIDGFGYALTGGSAYLLKQKLTDQQRSELLKELFSTDQNRIGISYLRISVGASDLDDEVFSYDDLEKGKTDPTLASFNLSPDDENLIPVLKEILAIAPGIKIMASPWSAPPWMKTNNSTKGGSLRAEFYDVYSRYLIKYVQEMTKRGITIDAITLQNEPENPNNNPSMVMTAEDQTKFVGSFLGPAFTAFGINTKIVVFDHNCDHPEYPISILDNARAKRYINGTAFHLYLGDITALSKVHDAHPDRNIYFTEQWTSGKGDFGGDLKWHIKNVIVGATRNWSRTVLEWNLANDPQFNPHTDDGGCTECLGAITIGDSVVRNVAYYIIAHASKFVRPGSVRIASTDISELPNVAFRDPSGGKVLIVLNEAAESKTFGIRLGKQTAMATLPAGSVGTFKWQ